MLDQFANFAYVTKCMILHNLMLKLSSQWAAQVQQATIVRISLQPEHDSGRQFVADLALVCGDLIKLLEKVIA